MIVDSVYAWNWTEITRFHHIFIVKEFQIFESVKAGSAVMLINVVVIRDSWTIRDGADLVLVTVIEYLINNDDEIFDWYFTVDIFLLSDLQGVSALIQLNWMPIYTLWRCTPTVPFLTWPIRERGSSISLKPNLTDSFLSFSAAISHSWPAFIQDRSMSWKFKIGVRIRI